MCQSIHIREVESLERWNKDQRSDQLEFARQKVAPCYLAFAATVCDPELVDARCSATKIAVLVTVIDDFFDFAGSEEELLNLIQLVEKWERHSEIEICSEHVEILFSAIYNTTNEYIEKASKAHGWNVNYHFIETWLELLNCMKKEAEWARNKIVPTLEDYMKVGYVSIALGSMTLAPMYFLGSQLSEEVVRSSEFKDMFKHMMMIGRLLNDLASVERTGQGKLNSVLLRMMSGLTEEEAVRETRRLIESHDKELLRMMLQTEGSVVPKACKDLFWRSGKVLHLFYLDNDGYSSQKEMVGAMNAVIYQPIRFPPYTS